MIKLTEQQIVNWIARHFDYRTRPNGELVIANPFYGNDNYKFNISTRSRINSEGRIVPAGMCHDWRDSNYNFSLVRFAQKFKSLSFYEALKDICGEGSDIKSIINELTKRDEKEPTPIHRMDLPDGSVRIASAPQCHARQLATNYLSNRCVDDNDIAKYDIHYCGSNIVFPYYEFDELCYWQSRAIISKRFLFPDTSKFGVGKEEFLFGFDLAEHSGDIIIAEAIFNSISIGHGALASGGALLQDRQRRKLRILSPARVILAPDLDAAGIKSIISNAKILGPYFELWYCLPPQGLETIDGKVLKDWNEYDQILGNKDDIIYSYIMENSKRVDTRSMVMLHKLAGSFER